MVAQGAAAQHDADVARARSGEAAEQRGRGAAGGDVVDADEAAAARAGHVGHQRDHHDAVRHEVVDRRPHQRMVQPHHHHRIAALAQAGEVPRQRHRREHVGALHCGQGALLGQPRRHRLDLSVEHVDEGVGARRQHEHQPGLGLAREAGGGRVGAVAQALDDGLHVIHRARPHAASAVQHAIHGRQADAGDARHVVQADAWFFRHREYHTGAV